MITDPPLLAGRKAMNSGQRVLIPAKGAVSRIALERIPGFAGIPDYPFAGNGQANDACIFHFTSSETPDIQLKFLRSGVRAPVNVSNAAFSTSRPNSLRTSAARMNTAFGLRIDFGTYDSKTTAFTAGKSVRAAALTVCMGPSTPQITVTVKFYDPSGKMLSEQKITNAAEGNSYGLAAYDADADKTTIAYIDYSYASSSANPVVCLDDLSFAPAGGAQ
ncbi:MAG: hypothetical protein WC959_11800 [Kiritimatiellales bacterium]